MNEEFLTWNLLGSYAGAVTVTALITQFLKSIPWIKRIPPQLLSFGAALVLLELAMLFSAAPSLENALLALINAVVVALSANGAYDAVHTVAPGRDSGADHPPKEESDHA